MPWGKGTRPANSEQSATSARVKVASEPTHFVYMLGHSQEERFDIIQRPGMNELSIVEPEADPEVIHKQREKSHHESDANGATKLVANQPNDQ